MRVTWIPPVLALAWGLNWPAVKTMLTALPPFSMRFIGLGLGAVLLLVLAAAQRRPLAPPRGGWGFVVIGGLLTIGLFNICTSFAQLSTTTSRAAVLTFTFPMMSAALAWLALGERLDRRGALALAVGGLGVAVLALPVIQRLTAPGPLPPLAGFLLPLGAALTWSLGTVATKRWPPVGDRMVLTAWQLLVGAGLTGVCSLLVGETLPSRWPVPVVAAMAFHVLVATMVAYVLWYRLLANVSATVASITTLAVPVVGVLGAMALVGERPSATDWLGFVLVLAGAALAALRRVPPAPPSTPAAQSASTG